MSKVSVIIPARNEIYLEKTIRNVLENAGGDIEIIVGLDNWIPEPQIVMNDNRVTFLHFKEVVGQRRNINECVKQSTGDYIMKLDAHCAVDKDFDLKLVADCEYDWTVIPRMYNLEIKTWKPKLIDDKEQAIRRGKLHDYMCIGFNEKNQFRTLYYPHNENKIIHSRTKLIDDTMSCMGCCFFMHKKRFLELGGCDEAHLGGWGQQGVEVSLKAWLSGGSLKVNKKTWFAHWFRGDIGFPYPISESQIDKVREYSKDLWLNNKWDKQVRKYDWLVDKFNKIMESAMPRPKDATLPRVMTLDDLTPEQKKTVDDFNQLFFEHWNRYDRKWLGTRIVKYPTDLFLYQMIIAKNKPDIIIETGAYMGGGALFFASMCDLVGHGQVLSIDRKEMKRPQHPRIKYIIGRSTAVDTLAQVSELCKGKTVMAILDSDHRSAQVKRELRFYSRYITKGQYLVVEDTMLGHCIDWKYGVNTNPLKAVRWFMERTKDFVQDPLELHYLISMSPYGWLRKVR